jgi:hypothetical protein
MRRVESNAARRVVIERDTWRPPKRAFTVLPFLFYVRVKSFGVVTYCFLKLPSFKVALQIACTLQMFVSGSDILFRSVFAKQNPSCNLPIFFSGSMALVVGPKLSQSLFLTSSLHVENPSSRPSSALP